MKLVDFLVKLAASWLKCDFSVNRAAQLRMSLQSALRKHPSSQGISLIHSYPPAPTALFDQELSRLAHRFNGITAVHNSLNYRVVLQALSEERPRSPDPTDRNLSKRDWESAVQQWRHELIAASLGSTTTPRGPDRHPAGCDSRRRTKEMTSRQKVRRRDLNRRLKKPEGCHRLDNSPQITAAPPDRRD